MAWATPFTVFDLSTPFSVIVTVSTPFSITLQTNKNTLVFCKGKKFYDYKLFGDDFFPVANSGGSRGPLDSGNSLAACNSTEGGSWEEFWASSSSQTIVHTEKVAQSHRSPQSETHRREKRACERVVGLTWHSTTYRRSLTSIVASISGTYWATKKKYDVNWQRFETPKPVTTVCLPPKNGSLLKKSSMRSAIGSPRKNSLKTSSGSLNANPGKPKPKSNGDPNPKVSNPPKLAPWSLRDLWCALEGRPEFNNPSLPYWSYIFRFFSSISTSYASDSSRNRPVASSWLSGFLSGCQRRASLRYL